MVRYKMALSGILVLVAGIALATEAAADMYNDLGSFQSATMNLSLVDFDTDPNGNPTTSGAQIGSTYSSLGVQFSPGNVFANLTGPVSGVRGWLNNTQVGSNRLFDLDFTANNVTAIGVHNPLGGSQPNGAILRAYDASNTLLASVNSDGNGQTLDFFGVTTNSAISRVTVTVIAPQGWALDDLYFGQVIPAPGAALLAMIGLGVVGWFKRRFA